LVRWAPFAFTVAFAAALLVRAGTAPADLVRYAAYASLAVLGPGTLVYRSLRRGRHTLVEDLAMGAAVGLTLELAAWATFSALDLRPLVWLWPALVYVPFAVIRPLRQHWWVRDYRSVPLGWSWSVAGVVSFWTAYLAIVFLDRNPILPTAEGTQQYLDLAYQLSLAGQAKHHFPPDLPQVAGEPLYYHWFAYAHMAMSSMVGSIDLPVVAMRLAIPALCALAIVLTATVAWRVSGRPYVGVIAAALFFAVGEFNFTHPVSMPFGTEASFVIWHGMSMIYAWVLLIALIAPLADVIARHDRRASAIPAIGSGTVRYDQLANRVPAIGPGAYGVATLLLFASAGAKASSLPVVGLAVGSTALVLLLRRRRIPWPVVGLGLIAGVAQLFAVAILFHFNSYGVAFGPLQGLRAYWAPPTPGVRHWVLVAGVWFAFLANMLLRMAGILPLLWLRRFRLTAVQWFLLAGGLAGPGLYLVFAQTNGGNQYFTRTGFAFGVMLSAWGLAIVADGARLSDQNRYQLLVGAVSFSILLVCVQLRYAKPAQYTVSYSSLVPILRWAGLLAGLGLVAGLCWWIAGRWLERRRPTGPRLRGRGAVVALTGVLVAGAPGLIMDEYKSLEAPNGGAYTNITMPKSKVDAARFVRDHSSANDVVATNSHCLGYYGDVCDSRVFWLSAYSERSVLVEGWGFAPRMAESGLGPFWDPAKLKLNDSAFTAPAAQVLRNLYTTYGVRWLVVDRGVGREAADLATFAHRRYDNGRVAVYELG
jgi:hypothetical protein